MGSNRFNLRQQSKSMTLSNVANSLYVESFDLQRIIYAIFDVDSHVCIIYLSSESDWFVLTWSGFVFTNIDEKWCCTQYRSHTALALSASIQNAGVSVCSRIEGIPNGKWFSLRFQKRHSEWWNRKTHRWFLINYILLFRFFFFVEEFSLV